MTTDPKEIEREAKSILSKEHFNMLIELFLFTPASFKQQINKYFADKNGRIKNNFLPGTTLRLRAKKEVFELQFKLPLPNGDKPEYEDVFFQTDDQKYESLFEKGQIFPGNVRDALSKNGIDPDFVIYLGDAETHRYTVIDSVLFGVNPQWKDVVVCLDQTTYPGGIIDYEIEVESKDLNYSKKVLFEILNHLDIPQTDGPTKIERFYKALENFSDR